MQYDPKATKKELIAICRVHKQPIQYELDELVQKDYEHEVLRLPPYHSFYNPIELVWGLAKRYYDKHVGRDNDYTEKMARIIWNEALAQITPEVWEKCCKKIEKRIREDYQREVADDDYPNTQFEHAPDDEDLIDDCEEMYTQSSTNDLLMAGSPQNNASSVCRALFHDIPSETV